jgi:magnesium chelatase family protein
MYKVKSFGILGVDGYVVDAEVDITKGLPNYTLVGLPDSAVREGKERVKSAVTHICGSFPVGNIVVNLAPAGTKKEGAVYDLPIAIGILGASGKLARPTDDWAFIGELGLDGEIRRVNGVLPALITATDHGIKNVIVPEGNSAEAKFVSGINIYSAKTLTQVVNLFSGDGGMGQGGMRRNGVVRNRTGQGGTGQDKTGETPTKVEPLEFENLRNETKYAVDMKFVRGQFVAKRALEIAGAGGHNILMIGPPGSGKTMLAKCFPTILPALTFDESLETTKIHSIAGTLDSEVGIILTRPFRSPHHTASNVALAGGGKNSRPGEISLAHNGVLFLDEMPEYTRNCLELLRQPLEDNSIIISRASGTVEYPASFTLVASMNPCPCGHYGSKTNKCVCTGTAIRRYLAKISSPLLDRIDLHIEVDQITYDDLSNTKLEEKSEEIRARVTMARERQIKRFDNTKIHCNAKMDTKMVQKHCVLTPECEAVLKTAFERLNLSARAYTRILKVARTIADLDGSADISVEHISEAVSYRSLDRLRRAK